MVNSFPVKLGIVHPVGYVIRTFSVLEKSITIKPLNDERCYTKQPLAITDKKERFGNNKID